jgi:mannose-6-phosphate isomerase-like protein (cupin superfamily)
MVTIVDLKAELGKLNMLRDRTPDMLEEAREASGGFTTLSPFRDGNLFSAKFSGSGAWERHPNGDELVQVMEGAATLHIMTDGEPQSYAVEAGMLVIVPQGAWHYFDAPDGVCLVTATPKPTEHLTVDVADPRTLSTEQLSGNTEAKWR